MEELIKSLLNSNNSLSLEEISKKLKISKEELTGVLAKMVSECTLSYNSKKKKYALLNNTSLKKATLVKRDNTRVYIKIDGENSIKKIVYTRQKFLREGDIVLVDVNNHFEQIIRVVVPNLTPIVSELYEENGINYVIDKLKLFNQRVEITKDETNLIAPGQIVVANYQSDNTGVVTRVIGHKDAVDKDVEEIFYKYGFPTAYDDFVLDEVKEIPSAITQENMLDKIDLRDEIIFTIDGKKTKDMDDAVYVSKINDDTYRIGVFDALNTEYIKDSSAIENDLITRGTSCYADNRVSAMIHSKLSNGICSLNPQTDRLAFAVMLDITKKGKITNVKVFDCIINSKIKMNYDDVNDLLENNIIKEEYQDYEIELKYMHEVANIVKNKMVKNGFIEFNTKESETAKDKDTSKISIVEIPRNSATKLIEFFMLLGNSAKTSYFASQGVPLIYRVHDKPDQDKLQEFFNYLIKKGYYEENKKRKIYFTSDIQHAINRIKGTKEEYVINRLGIRAQSRAEYSVENIGHYATGQKQYATFSSPMRRGPDYIDQKICRDYLKYGIEYVKENYAYDYLNSLAEHFTKKEIAAEKCESEIEKLRKVEYMQDYIGSTYQGIISGVQEYGLFVELDNTIEGFIDISKLNDDVYIYDKENFCLRGKEANKKYMLGDEICIIVSSASKQNKNIDFDIIKELNNNEKKTKEGKKKIKSK